VADGKADGPHGGLSDQRFTQTRWSLVLSAGGPDATEADAALERLCRTYWSPIYAFLRRKGYPSAEAQDLTQEFFAALLRRNAFAVASEKRGRFRTFLLVSLQNFLRDAHDKASALKRGGGTAIVALDSEDAERIYLEAPSPELGPEELYDRRWALTLVQAGFERLREEHARAGKLGMYEQLRGFLTVQPDAGDYDSAAATLGMKPGTVAVAVHRMRQRCRELLREELSQTVASPGDVDGEFLNLFGG
jgi:RNA polymerase sigma factor (sigma-70 family)